MSKKPFPKLNKNQMDPAKFGSTFGIAVWLMTMDKNHREKSIKELEEMILPAILLQQFKLYSKDGQPVAFLIWAAVSDEIKARIEGGNPKLELNEWRSGNSVMVLDCISPFNPKEVFEEEFWKGVSSTANNSSTGNQ